MRHTRVVSVNRIVNAAVQVNFTCRELNVSCVHVTRCTKITAIQRVMAGFRLHIAPLVGDNGSERSQSTELLAAPCAQPVPF